jgi:hypothetical protein
MHLFGRNRDHDYYFELLVTEEQDAQSVPTHLKNTRSLERNETPRYLGPQAVVRVTVPP